jgi:hypothetical protein
MLGIRLGSGFGEVGGGVILCKRVHNWFCLGYVDSGFGLWKGLWISGKGGGIC